eukprot:TRINITY_DN9443_c0_g1_i1.p1 TRINITY_DN9443_c0_g1~~TRINITY_DN9443_c0_g1_i1.p1  ORF type:complete len:624 (-),score=139.41 TRINITY_DN9443_c0_g1_i1:175-2046(-)
MGETGKRSRPQRDSDGKSGDGKYQKRRANDRENSSDGDLVVYRILCPGGIIGSVIGRSGKVINSLRQETHSRIKVVDPFPGADERVITIYCYVKDKDDKEVDEDDDMVPLCPAQDALLKVHSAIAYAVAAVGDSDKKRKEEAHILVPSSQAANIIGKSGSTIKKLRSKTRTNIKVTPKDPSDPTHSCAMSFDNFVQITGEPEAVKKALYAVSAIMFKFSPKEEISLDTSVPELPPSIIIPSDVPIYPTGSFYPSSDAVIPSRSVPPVVGATSHVPELHGYADSGSAWPAYSSALPVAPVYGGPSRSEELAVRVLCPSDKIGRVIGKGGNSIKSVRQSSGARVEVDDPKDDCDETVITVTSTESSDDIKSSAVEAVLLLQGKINVNDDDDKVNIRLLVPSKIIGCLIGKNGSIINEMRKKTKADVRISKKEKEKPKCAGEEDSLVEVIGDVGSVRDALVQIILRLRDYVLKDREGDQSAPIADSRCSSGYSAPSVLPSVPPVAPFGYDQRVDTGGSLGMLSSRSMYGYGSLQVGENGYESVPSYSSKLYEGFSSTREIVIPAHAVSKVMGKGGANIANIQKISGAVVEILDSKFSYSECVAYVSGTPEQKREAENLIEAFILAT